jgi:hypothetical protein
VIESSSGTDSAARNFASGFDQKKPLDTSCSLERDWPSARWIVILVDEGGLEVNRLMTEDLPEHSAVR